MASYLNNQPNLQSLLINPVQPLNEQVMQTIGARSQFYLQNLTQIKNQYDSTFDFNLSNEANIQSLQSQRQEADTKLKDIVKNDLSIGDYNKQALNLFKPISQDRNFLLDENLTNQIQKGFSQAQSDMTKFGADHYNALSVQAMNNTLKKWRSDSPSNIDGYLNDSLGTSYQPYDPKVSQQFYKDLDTHLKKESIKTETPGFQIGDAVYIRTDTGSKMNKLEADEYIRSIIPQQEKVQQDLQARVDLDDFSEIAKTPEGVSKVISHFNALKNYSIQKKIDHTNEQINSLELQKGLVPQSDANSDVIKQYNSEIKKYQNYRDNEIPSMFSGFDDTAYITPAKAKLAQAQASSLYLDRKVDGIVDAMGIGKVETTYRQDAAATSARNLAFNVEKQKSADYWKKLEYEQGNVKNQIELAKAKLKIDAQGKIVPIAGEGGANPNTHPVDVVAQASSPDEKATIIKEQIENQSNAIEQDLHSNLLTQLNAVVQSPNGNGNIDILSYMKSLPGNTPFSQVIDEIRGDDSTKDLIRSLVANVYSSVGGKAHGKNDFDKQPIAAIIPRINTMLSNPDIFNQAAIRAGVDNGEISKVASELAYQRASLESKRKNDYKQYGNIYQNAGKVLGVNLPKDHSVFNYSSDQYVNDLAPKLTGFSQSDINDLKKYIKGERVNNPKIYTTTSENIYSGPGMGAPHVVERINPALANVKSNWEAYQNQVKEGYKTKTGTSFNVNALRLSVASPERAGSDKFDPSSEISETRVLDLLDQASPNNPITGTPDPLATSFLKWKSAGLIQPKYLQNVVMMDEGTNNPYIKIEINPVTEKELKSAFDDKADDPSGLFNGTSWGDFKKDIQNTKIYIPKEKAQQYMGVQSSYTTRLRSGEDFDARLVSKNSEGKPNQFVIRDIGGPQPKVVSQGSAKIITRDGPTSFSISDRNLSSATELQRYTRLTQENISLNPEDSRKEVVNLDVLGTRLLQMLQRNSIPLKEDGSFDFKSLPKKLKQQILADKDLYSRYFNSQTLD